ncbi:MAG TPA: hypothetical protein VFS15_27945, partial [Kofleriaceae bacterium]|nr:hypothetical protein [Kofleriaceae bacterium]
MTTRSDRDIDTRSDERVGWAERQGNVGRIQSREDIDEFKPRDWRNADRFYTRGEDEDPHEDENERGWFDRVRDTASRWLCGGDDEDEHDYERDGERRGPGREQPQRAGSRTEHRWQADDDNQGRFRRREDNRRRQFASYEPEEDDRRGQFNRLHEDRGTLGRRGDAGLTGRTDYDRHDERGRFGHLAGDEERGRHYGEQTSNRPFGDERD